MLLPQKIIRMLHYPIENGMLDEVYIKEKASRPIYNNIIGKFSGLTEKDLRKIADYAKVSFFNQGITFNVYSDKDKGVERIFPFDMFPRIIPMAEWDLLERGLQQRNQAINLFIWDLYHQKHILRQEVIPPDLVFTSRYYDKQMHDFDPPGKVYTHVVGTDLIKHSDGKYYVLEDNLRCPSGVSYVLSNRDVMKRLFSDLFFQYRVKTVQDYPQQLLETILSVAPNGIENPNCVVLTPGSYNSAYFEHTFLAQSMGIPLVEGRDLFVENRQLYMKTIYGPKRVDVVYRRVDDEFIDPFAYRSDSLLGIPGLMSAYRSGNVTLLNAPGAGVADDKAVYAYLPDIIRYYLDEEPLLNNVETYRCEKDDEFKYVLDNMENLVIKPVDESGGYGLYIGNKSSKKETEECRKRIKANRRKYIAQPIMSLSTHATFIEDAGCFEPRHIDLRTFSLMGNNRFFALKGGLTRVALRKGSLVVNSSQGGGSKDTWVVDDIENF
jgi:uncharacterized circularly permuted ATP-grasp superfamily protein